LIAGLTVWAVLVPESLAYASIAGVSPVVGLYAAPPALLLSASRCRCCSCSTAPRGPTSALAKNRPASTRITALRRAGAEEDAVVFPSVEDAVSRAR
jgi:SulP family sulfate permease